MEFGSVTPLFCMIGGVFVAVIGLVLTVYLTRENEEKRVNAIIAHQGEWGEEMCQWLGARRLGLSDPYTTAVMNNYQAWGKEKCQSLLQQRHVENDRFEKLRILYVFGIAPVLPYPVCLLAAALSSTAFVHSKYPVLVNIYYILAFLYPLVPIALLVVSFIAHRKGYPRLAYATAVASLVCYAVLCMLSLFILEIAS